MCSLRICGSRRIVSSSVFGLNTSRCSSLFLAPWSHSVFHSARHRLRADAARFCPDSSAQMTAGITGRTSTLARSPLVRRCCARRYFATSSLHPFCFRPVRFRLRLIGRCRSPLPIQYSATSRSIPFLRPCCSFRLFWPLMACFMPHSSCWTRVAVAQASSAQQVGASV